MVPGVFMGGLAECSWQALLVSCFRCVSTFYCVPLIYLLCILALRHLRYLYQKSFAIDTENRKNEYQ